MSLFDDLHLKRLELLKDAFPRVRKVAILADSPWLAAWSGDALAAQAKARLGLATIVHVADSPDALDRLMNSSAAAHVDAWYIPPTYIAWLAQPALIAHLQRLRLPAIHATDDEVKAGALMAYSWDKDFAYDAMATLTLRIAAGEDAGSIPVERPRRYLLSIRIRAQDADGEPWARIAPAMVRRADRLY